MKKQTFKKKLVINKRTITELDDAGMDQVHGGVAPAPKSIVDTCYCPTSLVKVCSPSVKPNHCPILPKI